jgi:hypothetical protein
VVHITHPFHPRVGEAIDIVSRRRNFGDDRVYFRDRQGQLTSLPTQWTSLAEDDAFVVASAGRSPFRLVDLLDLVALVAGRRP